MLTKSLFLSLLALTLPFNVLSLRVPPTYLLKRDRNDGPPHGANSAPGEHPPPPDCLANSTGPVNVSQSGIPTPPSATLRPTPNSTDTPLPSAVPTGANATDTAALSKNATLVTNATTSLAVDGSSAYDGLIATAWYPSWLASKMPVESIPWSKYNTMTFAFGTTTPDPSVIELDSTSQELLPKFVEQAKQHDVKALLSIGGWTGSRYFSPAVATASNRATFMKTLLDLVDKYGLDGLDFDWEFPNKQALGCNLIDSADTANFLLLLQELRADPVGSKLILSAAVAVTPWAGPDGSPSADVSGFADVLDFIAIMAYDIWGAWSADKTVGPNAPLQDSCAAQAYRAGSVASAVNDWTAAGIPADQLVVGLASYGRAYTVEAAQAADKIGNHPTFSGIPLGEGETGEPSTDVCGVVSAAHSGLFNFEGLIAAGYLTDNGTAASGVKYHYDECSKTPFLYDEAKQIMISYDDAQSFAAKGEYIKESGVKGFAMWHAVGDSDDILLDSINKAVGRV